MGFSSNGREPLPRKRFSQWQVDAKRTHSRFDSDNYRLDPAGFVAANYFTTMREGQILKKARSGWQQAALVITRVARNNGQLLLFSPVGRQASSMVLNQVLARLKLPNPPRSSFNSARFGELPVNGCHIPSLFVFSPIITSDCCLHFSVLCDLAFNEFLGYI